MSANASPSKPRTSRSASTEVAVSSPSPSVATPATSTSAEDIFYGYIDVSEASDDGDSNPLQIYVIDQQKVTIGRDHHNDLRFNHLKVSRQQYEITFAKNTKDCTIATLKNLSTRKTSTLNKTEIPAGESIILNDNDEFSISDYNLRWREYDPENPTGQIDKAKPRSSGRISTTKTHYQGSAAENKKTNLASKSFSGSSNPKLLTPSSKGKGKRRSVDSDMRKAVLKKELKKAINNKKGINGSATANKSTTSNASTIVESEEDEEEVDDEDDEENHENSTQEENDSNKLTLDAEDEKERDGPLDNTIVDDDEDSPLDKTEFSESNLIQFSASASENGSFDNSSASLLGLENMSNINLIPLMQGDPEQETMTVRISNSYFEDNSSQSTTEDNDEAVAVDDLHDVDEGEEEKDNEIEKNDDNDNVADKDGENNVESNDQITLIEEDNIEIEAPVTPVQETSTLRKSTRKSSVTKPMLPSSTRKSTRKCVLSQSQPTNDLFPDVIDENEVFEEEVNYSLDNDNTMFSERSLIQYSTLNSSTLDTSAISQIGVEVGNISNKNQTINDDDEDNNVEEQEIDTPTSTPLRKSTKNSVSVEDGDDDNSSQSDNEGNASNATLELDDQELERVNEETLEKEIENNDNAADKDEENVVDSVPPIEEDIEESVHEISTTSRKSIRKRKSNVTARDSMPPLSLSPRKSMRKSVLSQSTNDSLALAGVIDKDADLPEEKEVEEEEEEDNYSLDNDNSIFSDKNSIEFPSSVNSSLDSSVVSLNEYEQHFSNKNLTSNDNKNMEEQEIDTPRKINENSVLIEDGDSSQSQSDEDNAILDDLERVYEEVVENDDDAADNDEDNEVVDLIEEATETPVHETSTISRKSTRKSAKQVLPSSPDKDEEEVVSNEKDLETPVHEISTTSRKSTRKSTKQVLFSSPDKEEEEVVFLIEKNTETPVLETSTILRKSTRKSTKQMMPSSPDKDEEEVADSAEEDTETETPVHETSTTSRKSAKQVQVLPSSPDKEEEEVLDSIDKDIETPVHETSTTSRKSNRKSAKQMPSSPDKDEEEVVSNEKDTETPVHETSTTSRKSNRKSTKQVLFSSPDRDEEVVDFDSIEKDIETPVLETSTTSRKSSRKSMAKHVTPSSPRKSMKKCEKVLPESTNDNDQLTLADDIDNNVVLPEENDVAEEEANYSLDNNNTDFSEIDDSIQFSAFSNSSFVSMIGLANFSNKNLTINDEDNNMEEREIDTPIPPAIRKSSLRYLNSSSQSVKDKKAVLDLLEDVDEEEEKEIEKNDDLNYVEDTDEENVIVSTPLTEKVHERSAISRKSSIRKSGPFKGLTPSQSLKEDSKLYSSQVVVKKLELTILTPKLVLKNITPIINQTEEVKEKRKSDVIEEPKEKRRRGAPKKEISVVEQESKEISVPTNETPAPAEVEPKRKTKKAETPKVQKKQKKVKKTEAKKVKDDLEDSQSTSKRTRGNVKEIATVPLTSSKVDKVKKQVSEKIDKPKEKKKRGAPRKEIDTTVEEGGNVAANEKVQKNIPVEELKRKEMIEIVTIDDDDGEPKSKRTRGNETSAISVPAISSKKSKNIKTVKEKDQVSEKIDEPKEKRKRGAPKKEIAVVEQQESSKEVIVPTPANETPAEVEPKRKTKKDVKKAETLKVQKKQKKVEKMEATKIEDDLEVSQSNSKRTRGNVKEIAAAPISSKVHKVKEQISEPKEKKKRGAPRKEIVTVEQEPSTTSKVDKVKETASEKIEKPKGKKRGAPRKEIDTVEVQEPEEVEPKRKTKKAKIEDQKVKETSTPVSKVQKKKKDEKKVVPPPPPSAAKQQKKSKSIIEKEAEAQVAEIPKETKKRGRGVPKKSTSDVVEEQKPKETKKRRAPKNESVSVIVIEETPKKGKKKKSEVIEEPQEKRRRGAPKKEAVAAVEQSKEKGTSSKVVATVTKAKEKVKKPKVKVPVERMTRKAVADKIRKTRRT